jgi:hypothetical protein
VLTHEISDTNKRKEQKGDGVRFRQSDEKSLGMKLLEDTPGGRRPIAFQAAATSDFENLLSRCVLVLQWTSVKKKK